MSEQRAASGLRIALLGWQGSRPRHLEAIARVWKTLGATDVVTHVPASMRFMALPHGSRAVGRELVQRLREREPMPFVFHAHSNAGFWTEAAALEAMTDPALRALLRGSVLDSGPGFPPRITARFTSRTATQAMMPTVLAALGRPPALSHPILTPVGAVLFGAWHFVAPVQRAFMERSLEVVARAHAGLPLDLLYGGADALIPTRHVEAFADLADARGAHTERTLFPDGEHVRLLVAHRAAYVDGLRRFAARVRRDS